LGGSFLLGPRAFLFDVTVLSLNRSNLSLAINHLGLACCAPPLGDQHKGKRTGVQPDSSPLEILCNHSELLRRTLNRKRMI
jgi:hypothetical protein